MFLFLSAPLTCLLHASNSSAVRPSRPGSRRQSVSSTRSRIPSASFLHFADTPQTPAHPIPATPLPADAKFDFVAFGHVPIFVDVPVSTPITPGIYKPRPTTRSGSAPATPVTKTTGMFERLLGSEPKTTKSQAKAQAKGGKADVNPIVLDNAPSSLKKCSEYSVQSSPEVEKRKREVYATALPSTVVQEARMRRGIEGGRLEHNIRKIMEEKAKQEGTAVKVSSTEGKKVVEGIETAHRDAQGGIWWDQEEEWEFAHLLAAKTVSVSARCVDSERWITFDNLKSKEEDERDDFTDFASLPSSKCIDLHCIRPLLISDDSTEQLVRDRTKRSSSVVGSIILPSPSINPSKIILAVPSKPTRAKHLLQPGFLKGVVAVPPTPSTASTYSQTSSYPRSPGRVT